MALAGSAGASAAPSHSQVNGITATWDASTNSYCYAFWVPSTKRDFLDIGLHSTRSSLTLGFGSGGTQGFKAYGTSTEIGGTRLLTSLNGVQGCPQATPPKLTVDPSSLNWGNVPVGLSPILQVTITNRGTEASGGLLTSFLGNDAGAFVPTYPETTCTGGAVLGRSSCVLALRFQPTAARIYSATLDVTANPGADHILVPLSGTGTGTTATAARHR
jgi:hypothetical protein